MKNSIIVFLLLATRSLFAAWSQSYDLEALPIPNEGFKTMFVAKEPELMHEVCMCFDKHGNLMLAGGAQFRWPKPDKRREFLRARLNEAGELELHPHQGSGVLSSAAWSDGLVDLPPQTPVNPGDRLRWLPWSELLHPALGARQP